MTKQEITDKMCQETPYFIPPQTICYIHEAMDIYAKSEAIAFANWLANAEYTRETVDELWERFQNETT